MAHRILGGIYLLSFEPINKGTDLNQEYGITHVLSALPGPLPAHLTENYKSLQIDITDEESTNILKHIPITNAFIDEALFLDGQEQSKKHTGAVLVHCAQGESRSVAFVAAYLMAKYKLTKDQALHAITRKVPGAKPNESFLEQLEIFQSMGSTVDLTLKQYKQFLISQSLKSDPSGGQLRQLNLWPTETKEKESSSEFNLRCKRCRLVLATDQDLETHEIPDADSRQSQFIKRAPHSRRVVSAINASKTCSHYFVDEPLLWMHLELLKLDMEGKFACPKCELKVGGYSWKGSRCSCGKWMIPALHLQTAKVDCMKRT